MIADERARPLADFISRGWAVAPADERAVVGRGAPLIPE
jgi:hypothetical protein